MKKLIALLLALTLFTVGLTACVDKNEANETDDTVIRIAYMNGPTGMGMAKLIHDNGGTNGNEKYQFVKYTDAALATADLREGKVDMACIPTNTAATLYNKFESINVLALNCLNSLYVMTKTGVVIEDFSDLEGKTIYTIQNGTPAAILNYLLEETDVNATVKTSIGEGENEKSITAPTDLVPLLVAGSIDIALVPEPVATAAPLKIASQNKDYTYTVAIDLTDAWAEISDSPVAMGCIVANKDFVNEHKSVVDTFLSEYKHPFYVSRMLKERKGMTLRQYIIAYRLKCAKRMLELSDKSAAEIAEECGFTDASYFAKTFKATFGMTPKEYRNSFKEDFI